MPSRTVVVAGGGIGGVVAARRLRRLLRPDDRVVLVERQANLQFAPSFLWVMTSARQPDQVSRDVTRLRGRGIEVLVADIVELDVTSRQVKTTGGALNYDRLVVALGATLAPEVLPGFADGAVNLFTLDGALEARRALAEFEGGRVAVLVSSMPYKCPAAPHEAALLAEAVLRRRGVPVDAIDIYTPEPAPMPVTGQAVGEAVATLLASRGIGFHGQHQAESIEPDEHVLVFRDGQRASYDLLLGVPPHRPPEVVQTSGLAGDTGFVAADPRTLQTSAEGVLAIGDVIAIPLANGMPLPKAGVFAEREAEVAARRIASEFKGRAPTQLFDGHGSCFLEIGDGRAAFATGDFYAEGKPTIKLRSPGRRWHAAKVAWERYWLHRWPR